MLVSTQKAQKIIYWGYPNRKLETSSSKGSCIFLNNPGRVQREPSPKYSTKKEDKGFHNKEENSSYT